MLQINFNFYGLYSSFILSYGDIFELIQMLRVINTKNEQNIRFNQNKTLSK